MPIKTREKRSQGQTAGPAKGITARAVILGFVISVAHTCWIVYEEIALGHIWATSYMLFPSVIGILFALLAVNSLLKRLNQRWVLSPSELMVVFCMTTVAASLAALDLLQNLLPNLMWPFQTPDRVDTYGKYFSYIPRWFMPQDKALIRGYFVGNEDFWRFFRPEVFRPWLLPMAFWGGFLTVLALTSYCLGSVLRRQWADREKLTFPIIELPLMMVRENTVGSLFRSRLLLGGFAASAVVLSLNCLSALFPALPSVPLNMHNVGHLLTQRPFSGMAPIYMSWWPFAVGLCYLMPLDVSFSCWFFYVVMRLSMAYGTAMGWRDPTAGLGGWPYFNLLAQGAWVGMFIVVMRAAKGHLGRVWRIAVGSEKTADDDREPLSYRTAAFGSIAGLLALAGMMVISGVRPHIALFLFAVYLLATVVIARIYAQVAVPMFELAHYRTLELTANLVGSKAMNPQEMTVLSDLHWIDRTYRYHVMGHQLEAMTFAEKQGESMRKLTHAIVLALVTGIVVGMLTMFQVYYYRGAACGALAYGGQPWTGSEAWTRHYTWVTSPKSPQLVDLARIGTSAGIVVALAAARNAWFAFPLNPVGYVLASSYAMEYVWNIVLVTWLVKLLVLRYGGLALYRRSLPLFYGLALGDAVTQCVWALIMIAIGVSGVSCYGPMQW